MSFVQVTSLDTPEHASRYDAVFCMEVLEHVFDWEPELARMSRLLAPGGTLVVSVPVETGVPVLVKQIVRTIAGWRKIGHYPGNDVVLVERARIGRLCRPHAACETAGLRFWRRSRARSQRLQLAGAARTPDAAVRRHRCGRKPVLVARPGPRHTGVVYCSPSRACARYGSSLAMAEQPR